MKHHLHLFTGLNRSESCFSVNFSTRSFTCCWLIAVLLAGMSSLNCGQCFGKVIRSPLGGSPSSMAIAVGDFNGDGRPDLATANKNFTTANNSTGAVSLLLNGTTQEADGLTVSPNPTADVVRVSLTDAYQGVALITLTDAGGRFSKRPLFSESVLRGGKRCRCGACRRGCIT